MTDETLFGDTKKTEDSSESTTKIVHTEKSLSFDIDNPKSQEEGEDIKEEGESNAGKEEVSWMVDDQTAGKGERPEWFKTKYKTVMDQAKAYTDLEKMKEAPTAPEKYDFSELPDDHVLDLESEAMKEWVALKKEQRASDTQVKKELLFMNKYMGGVKAGMVSDREAEIEKLGGADAYAQKREAFENRIYNILEKDDAVNLLHGVTSANIFNAINKLITHFQETPVAQTNPVVRDTSHLKMKKEAYMNMISQEYSEEFKKDRNFRNTVWKNIKEINAQDQKA